MKAINKFLHIERLREEPTQKLIVIPDIARHANPFPRGIVRSKGKGVTIEVEVGDEVIFQLYNAASIRGMLYHIHQDNVTAKVER